MAKELSRLFVVLGLDDKGFKSQLKQIDKQMSAMGKTMVATGAAIVAGMGMAVKAWAAAGDEVQKMGLRTHWSAESLSELRHVAQISGTELDAFEKGTRKMSQSITYATDGLTTYTREFDRLGLNVEELRSMKPEEAFWVIAEAIAGMGSEIEMSSTAMAIFGRTGTQLLPMLKEGADGIERLRKEAHDLGIVFDQEAADNAARLTDTLQRLKESFQGVTYEVAEQAAPTIESYAGVVTDAVKATRRFADEHSELSNILVNTGLSFGGTLTLLGGAVLLLPKLTQGFTTLAGALTKGALAGKALFGALSLGVAGLTMIGTGVGLLIQHFSKYNDQLESHKALLEGIEKFEIDPSGKNEKALRDLMEAHADYLEVYVKQAGLSKKAKEEQYKYIEALREQVERYDDYQVILADINGFLEEQRAQLEATREQIQGMIDAVVYATTEAAKMGITIQDITAYMVAANRETELFGLNWEWIGEDANRMASALGLSIEEVAIKTGKLTEETSALKENIMDIIDTFKYEQSEAGQLGITFDDIVTSLFAAGLNVDWFTEKIEEMGEEAKDVNKILEEFGLTPKDIERFLSGKSSPGAILRDVMRAAGETEGVPFVGFPSYQGWEGTLPGPPGKAYAAIVHGGEYLGQAAKAGTTITNQFHIGSLVVREEADVRKIARELYIMQQVRV